MVALSSKTKTLHWINKAVKAVGLAQFRKPEGVEHTTLLGWMMLQTNGLYAVEYYTHCVTWYANQQLIMDSDPRFPKPLPINQETLDALHIKRVEKVYQITPGCAKKDKKKRKRYAGGWRRRRKEEEGEEEDVAMHMPPPLPPLLPPHTHTYT